jgi:predicted outer membrane protein
VLAALILVVFQYWGTSQYGTAIDSPGQVSSRNPDWTSTQWGPLGQADRDLLVMLRQAGLSEASSGRQAQRQSSNIQVRTIAKTISMDCGELDKQVRSVAGKLGVPLPEAPTAAQQAWMTQLSGQTGVAYDRMFAQNLRHTEGAVLPAITAVRAGTRNELIRSFAANAATMMTRHMDVLERTGLIDYTKLPAPPPPATGPEQQIEQVANTASVPPAGSVGGTDINAMVAALISIAALLIALGLIGTGRRLRKPPAAQHRSTPQPQQRRHAAHRW